MRAGLSSGCPQQRTLGLLVTSAVKRVMLVVYGIFESHFNNKNEVKTLRFYRFLVRLRLHKREQAVIIASNVYGRTCNAPVLHTWKAADLNVLYSR